MAAVAAVILVVVIYCRVSTEEQKKRGFSLREQEDAGLQRARDLARTAGAELRTYIFSEQGSGEVLDREELDRAREFIRSNRVDYFICRAPDRLARDAADALVVVREIERRGTALEFLDHNYERTPAGRLFLTLRAGFAEYEKAVIKERTTRGRRRKLAEGGIPNAVFAYGYRWDKERKRPVPERSPDGRPTGQLLWAERFLRWALDERLSPQQIATRLNDLGVPGPGGGKWYRATVARLLRHPIYAGRVIMNRWDCEGLTPLRTVPKARRDRPLTNRLRPAEEWVEVRLPDLAIITEDEWAQLQEHLAGRRRLSQRGAGLLSGLVTCGLCGSPMHYVPADGGYVLRCPGRYPHWRRTYRRAQQEEACRQPHQRASWFEEAISAEVRALLEDPERAMARYRAAVAEAPADTGEASALAARLQELRDEHRRAFYLAQKGLAPDDIEDQLAALKRQIAHAEARLAELQRPYRDQAALEAAATRFTDRARTLSQQLLALWDRLDDGRRRAAVREVVAGVTVLPQRQYRVEWRV